jgi:2-methylcitrate dehydratase PrpD
LADFLASCRIEDIPPEVFHEAKRSMLNYFAAALGGCNDAAVERAIKVLSPLAGKSQASLIGRRERLDLLTAAFLNAVSTNVFDFDDTHPDTVIHPTAPVAPAALALAEASCTSGAEVLQALALGVETECRIGNTVSPWHYSHGWHITSTCGVFGSAVAAGKLLGLDGQKMLWALGNASSQSSGLLETLGTMAKSIGVGNSSRGGIVAALAAQAGIYGPEMPLEGPRGFCNVMGQNPDFSAITAGLGQRWEALRNTYKPYPSGIVLHSVIEACLDLRRRPDFELDRVKEIVVRGHPLLGQRTDRPNVTTGREAQVSAQHSVAAVLLTGKAGLAQFSDAAVSDPAIIELRSKVRVENDASMTIQAAEVIITLTDGLVLTKRVEDALGGEKRPLTDAELEDKLRDLVAFGGSGIAPQPLIDAVWSMDSNPDAGRIVALAVAR